MLDERRDNTETAGSLWTELCLEDGDSGVYESHSDSRYDASYDHVCSCVGGCLQQSTDNHDDYAYADGFPAAELLAEEGDADTAEETSYFVDGHNQTRDGWTG